MPHRYGLVGIRFLVVILGMLLLGIWVIWYRMPQFHAHTCIQLATDREPWDPPQQIWHIERVGRKHYLVRKYPFSVYKDVEGVSLSFMMARDYQPVECMKDTPN